MSNRRGIFVFMIIKEVIICTSIAERLELWSPLHSFLLSPLIFSHFSYCRAMEKTVQSLIMQPSPSPQMWIKISHLRKLEAIFCFQFHLKLWPFRTCIAHKLHMILVRVPIIISFTHGNGNGAAIKRSHQCKWSHHICVSSKAFPLNRIEKRRRVSLKPNIFISPPD